MNLAKHKAIGIYGGTFDPIHLGHTQTAASVASWLNLEHIILLPAKLPNLKTPPKTTAKHRVKMVECVCNENPLFICDSRELNRTGYSYTVETLREFKQEYPEYCLYFIIGMDSLLNFTQWHQYQEILTLCHLVVNTRPNYSLAQMNLATKQLLAKHRVDSLTALKLKQEQNQGAIKANSGGIIFSPAVYVDISSTEIREKLSTNSPLEKNGEPLLSATVLDFINKNQLYR